MEQRRYVSLAFWARDKREQAGVLADIALATALKPWAFHAAAPVDAAAQLEPRIEPELSWPQVA